MPKGIKGLCKEIERNAVKEVDTILGNGTAFGIASSVAAGLARATGSAALKQKAEKLSQLSLRMLEGGGAGRSTMSGSTDVGTDDIDGSDGEMISRGGCASILTKGEALPLAAPAPAPSPSPAPAPVPSSGDDASTTDPVRPYGVSSPLIGSGPIDIAALDLALTASVAGVPASAVEVVDTKVMDSREARVLFLKTGALVVAATSGDPGVSISKAAASVGAETVGEFSTQHVSDATTETGVLGADSNS